MSTLGVGLGSLTSDGESESCLAIFLGGDPTAERLTFVDDDFLDLFMA